MDQAPRVSSRRKFFAGVAVGAGATALPHWLAHAFGLRGVHIFAGDLDAPEWMVDAGWGGPECTVADTRPGATLVLVIPREPGDRWNRGYALGAWLNYGSDSQLAPLAAVDVRCALVSELEDLGGQAVEGEPWAVLIDERTGRSRAIELQLPAMEDLMGGGPNEDDPFGDRHDENQELRASVQQIDMLAAAIVGAIEAELPALAEMERTRLESEDRAHLDRLLSERAPLPHALVERNAAQLLLRMRDGSSEPAADFVRSVLAEAVRVSLVARRIPGSRWAVGGGCGVHIEGEDPVAVGCGMGHVPRLSRRFLHFFSDQ
jgi:hypothetical protein